MRILGVDPGGTTGVCLYDTDAHHLERWQLLGRLNAESMIDILLKRSDVVVIEEFVITATTHKKSRQPDAMYIIGACEWLSIQHDVPFEISKLVSKKHAPDATLRALDMYKAGMKHSNDAARHIVSYMIRNDLVDLGEMLALIDTQKEIEK